MQIIKKNKTKSWSKTKFIFLFCSSLMILGLAFLGLFKAKDIAKRLWITNQGRFARAISRQLNYYKQAQTISIDKIEIDIKQEDLFKLQYDRATAKEDVRPYQLVPVKISHNKGKKFKAKLRLKGDRLLHTSHPYKWSMRVNLSGSKSIMGMKVFTLQRPLMRNYIWEWIYQKMLYSEGLTTLRYDFVSLYVNGKDYGTYAIEEHFDKRLLENRGHLEGPILKFDEGVSGTKILKRMPITSFNKKKWTLAENIPTLEAGIDLLQKFINKELSVDEVFDTKKLARLYAISDLLGTHHGVVAKSLRFYYNPVIAKLEPLAFDGHAGPPSPAYPAKPPVKVFTYLLSSELAFNDKAFYYIYSDWFELLFKPSPLNESFIKEYTQVLSRISKENYLQAFLKKEGKELQEKLALMHLNAPLWEDKVFSEGSELFEFSIDQIEARAKYIRRTMNQPRFFYANLESQKNNQVEILFSNVEKLPIQLVSLKMLQDKKESILKINQWLPPRNGWDREPSPSETIFSYSLPQKPVAPYKLFMTYLLPGTHKQKEQEVFLWKKQFLEKQIDLAHWSEQELKALPFIEIEQNKIIFKQGHWKVENIVIIPPKYEVKITPGSTFDLMEDAAIISYSPINAIGSKEKKIRFTSSKSNGGGFAVLMADKKSILRHVVFEKLKAPQKGRWKLSGSVSFYESDVDFEDCEFRSNYSEDFLNIKRSQFSLKKSLFLEAHSDAIDLDFSTGLIENSHFISSGNDAIDISGGKGIQILRTKISRAGDKGISVGEAGIAYTQDVDIEEVEIGIASKDSSILTGENINISRSHLGMTVFNKKSEYGPGKIDLKSVSLHELGEKYLVEDQSILVLNDQKIEAEKKNVKGLLYGVEFGKSSK